MRHIGPKNRIARREAMDLGLKTPVQSLMQIFSRKSIFRPASTAQEGVLRKYLNGENNFAKLKTKIHLRTILKTVEEIFQDGSQKDRKHGSFHVSVS